MGVTELECDRQVDKKTEAMEAFVKAFIRKQQAKKELRRTENELGDVIVANMPVLIQEHFISVSVNMETLRRRGIRQAERDYMFDKDM